MKNRIALISANKHKEPYPVYPLGIAYLKSYLLKKMPMCYFDTLDMNMLSLDELVHYIKLNNPSAVCISMRNIDCFSSSCEGGFFDYYTELINTIRSVISKPIIIGGTAFSIFPDIFMQKLDVDYGIKGEGEELLYQILEAVVNRNTTQNIDTKGNSVLYSKSLQSQHSCKPIECPSVLFDDDLVDYYWRNSGVMSIQTKRGCPHNCVFCPYPAIYGKKVRTVDIDSIIDSIKEAKQRGGINYWFFTDPVFNIANDYNIELAQAIIDNKLDISWGAYFSPANITNDQMAIYKKSGLTHIEFGTESFCDQTLKDYGKLFTFDDILKASNLALKHNVNYCHTLTLAGYGDSQKRILETIENSKRLSNTVIFPNVGLRIYPNTRLQQMAILDGTIDANDDLFESKIYIHKDFDLERTRSAALKTGKAWVFDDDPTMLLNCDKVGLKWECLIKP